LAASIFPATRVEKRRNKNNKYYQPKNKLLAKKYNTMALK
jgi:hypothetical protein